MPLIFGGFLASLVIRDLLNTTANRND